MAENTIVREDQSDHEEDWDAEIERETTEQQQTTQGHTTHQQVQTTLNDDEDEDEPTEYHLTAAGGAIRKTQTNAAADETKTQTEGGIVAEETQYDAEGHGPKSNLYRERDYTAADEYSIPGDIILQQIENQALTTAEEKDHFNTTTNHLSQEQFVHLCDKTRRSFGQLVQYMANTRDVIADYKALRDKDRGTKILLPELIPTHAHTWPAANALAFRAAVLHLNKIGMKVGGSTDGKFFYQLIMTQLNVARDDARDAANVSRLQHELQHNATANASAVQAMNNLFEELNITTTPLAHDISRARVQQAMSAGPLEPEQRDTSTPQAHNTPIARAQHEVEESPAAVSYTHLTLPTNREV